MRWSVKWDLRMDELQTAKDVVSSNTVCGYSATFSQNIHVFPNDGIEWNVEWVYVGMVDEINKWGDHPMMSTVKVGWLCGTLNTSHNTFLYDTFILPNKTKRPPTMTECIFDKEVLCCVTLRYVMLYYGALCYIMLCYAMLCYVALRYVTLC